ncbi:MAG TPA: hypothetical protein DD435_00655 [Cyanobacteria bacterium UBA8530]|nr:hypothetical protein [Cyanobacteria bacterium UBA8530]
MNRWKKNFILNMGDGAAFNGGMAFIAPAAILPLFVHHYTSAGWVLGLVMGLFMLGLCLPQPFGAANAAQLSDLWSSVRGQFLLPRLALVGMATTPWLPDHLALPGFFLFFTLYSFFLGFQIPLWYAFLAQFVPPEERGKFFGYRGAFGGLFGLLGALAAGWCLQSLPHPWGFGSCFFMAALLQSISYLFVTSTEKEEREIERPEASFFASGLALLRENSRFKRYLLSRIVLSGSTMATAFYVIHAKSLFSLTAAQSSLLAIALVYLPATLGVIWGPLSDTWGARNMQVGGAVLAGVANLFILGERSLYGYLALLFLAGCGNLAVTQLDGKWLMELDEGRQGAVVSFFNLALVPSTALLPMVAGFLSDYWGMPSVFAATAGFWLSGGLMLAFLVEERGISPRPRKA